MPTVSASSLSYRLRRATFNWRLLAKIAAVWLAWAVLELVFELLRNLGDDTFTPRGVERAERALFGVTPTRFLQAEFHEAGWVWLDKVSYLLHGFWFGLPFAFAIVVSIYQRRRLIEFWSWLLATCYVGAIFFLLLPVRPPWMEGGVSRILIAGDNVDYASLDGNPVAAFPSLHAALPATMALFLFVRFSSRPFYAWLATSFALSIGFAVVYLGEHWVIDVLAGYALAGFTAFLFLHRWPRRVGLALPGDPVGKLIRLNDRLFPDQTAAMSDLCKPEELSRAA